MQPYVETHVRDPRLWTKLGITADHSDFIAFIVGHATTHPSTKATTELLFMLDDMAQGSRDALLALLDIDPLKDLWWWTRTRNEDAHGLVMVLQRHYRDKLAARGIGSARDSVTPCRATNPAVARLPRLAAREFSDVSTEAM